MSHPQSTYAIEARRLGKRFGTQWALAHVDLTVEPGEVLLLAGANGSGKSTLLRCIAGLYKPNKGTLEVYGNDSVKERLACRRDLSLIGHDNYLYSQLTAAETLRVWARLRGVDDIESTIDDLLDSVDLYPHRNKATGGFSAGMRKRLTMLRTRLEGPRIVLLDEPFSALDSAGQSLVENWIHEYRAAGKTVVMASHSLERWSRICDRAVYLRAGQLEWMGSGDGLLRRVGTSA
ncbi:MAG: heme ABC exporter ATP-binding protein CcmA [Deltaproteobacteria bacterium]|nr:heme ABC exporter ATP-binding protein CcmA [Deltaproteobacteria bacterium]